MSEVENMGRDMNKVYKYRKDTQKRIEFYVHKELDKDVLDWLETKPNKRQYLLDLIRADMKKGA